MSNNRKKSLAVPDGWADVFVRTLTVLLVAFVTLNVKEWMETREFDILACAIDAVWIAVGMFLVWAILTVASGVRHRTEERLAVPSSR